MSILEKLSISLYETLWPYVIYYAFFIAQCFYSQNIDTLRMFLFKIQIMRICSIFYVNTEIQGGFELTNTWFFLSCTPDAKYIMLSVPLLISSLQKSFQKGFMTVPSFSK